MNQTFPKVVALTGNRHNSLTLNERLCAKHNLNMFVRFYIQNGTTTFISGGAIGSDLDFALAVIAQKNALNRPDVDLNLYLPFENHYSRWRKEDVEILQLVVNNTQNIRYLERSYSNKAYHARNHAMVKDCDQLWAIFNGIPRGGTYATLQYAQSVGKPITLIPIDKQVFYNETPKPTLEIPESVNIIRP